MTRSEALLWGRGDQRRITTADFPAAVVALVDERLRGRYCVDCRELDLVTPADVPLQLDHIEALSGRGDNNHLNLTWRCRSHNCAKGDKKAATRPGRPRWARRRSRPAG